MRYSEEVAKAMNYLAEHPKTIFLGQAIAYPGNAIYKNMEKVSLEKKLELPVFEEVQLGMSIGMALEGLIPVSVFPRFNFLLLAVNQLVNHLDKLPHMSKGGFQPKVIIKTMVGSIRPLHPGVQHCGNFTEAFRHLVDRVKIVDLQEAEEVFPAYQHALDREDGVSTLLVEHGDYYNEK
jgi:pyruvate/2-oxoglutarate/acetoin dehydrogenase E1 component